MKLITEINRVGNFDFLSSYGIEVKPHPVLPLKILNYDQIDSHKFRFHDFVREARGTVIEWKDNKASIVGRAFPRFFNYGESIEDEKAFNWGHFKAIDKEDGSLILLYHYDGEWRVNTRNSWADAKIDLFGGTWKDLFLSTINDSHFHLLMKSHTWIFELCTPFNKVVRNYPNKCSFLLSAIHNETGVELSDELLDTYAKKLCVNRPKITSVSTIEDVKELLKKAQDPTFEGVVLRDNNQKRIKAKQDAYVALHKLANNGKLASVKNLIPLVVSNDYMEVLVSFEELGDKVYELIQLINGEREKMLAVYNYAIVSKKSQKEFALYIQKHIPQLSFVCFKAKRENRDINDVWKESVVDIYTKRL